VVFHLPRLANMHMRIQLCVAFLLAEAVVNADRLAYAPSTAGVERAGFPGVDDVHVFVDTAKDALPSWLESVEGLGAGLLTAAHAAATLCIPYAWYAAPPVLVGGAVYLYQGVEISKLNEELQKDKQQRAQAEAAYQELLQRLSEDVQQCKDQNGRLSFFIWSAILVFAVLFIRLALQDTRIRALESEPGLKITAHKNTYEQGLSITVEAAAAIGQALLPSRHSGGVLVEL
jgi:hypothetical protein